MNTFKCEPYHASISTKLTKEEFCKKRWKKAQKYGTYMLCMDCYKKTYPDRVDFNERKTCQVNGCGNKVIAQGYCSSHYWFYIEKPRRRLYELEESHVETERKLMQDMKGLKGQIEYMRKWIEDVRYEVYYILHGLDSFEKHLKHLVDYVDSIIEDINITGG